MVFNLESKIVNYFAIVLSGALGTILLMQKVPGFSLIEIMTTITIMGIVAVVAMPEYWRLRARDAYRAEGQVLFDTILDARNAALTNKLCNDDNSALRWTVFMVPNTDPVTYELRCYRDMSNYTVEQSSVSLSRSDLESVDFNETALPAAMDGSGGAPYPNSIRFSFFSGGVNGRLEYDDGTVNKADSVAMILGHDESAFQHTICFNRVSGFPTFNKNGTTCQDY